MSQIIRNTALVALFAFPLIFWSTGCKKENDDNLSAALLVAGASNLAETYYQFYGKVDETLTASCGDATADSTTTSTTTTSARLAPEDPLAATATSTSTSTSTSDKYKITSYYVVKGGESALTWQQPINQATVYMKYRYDSSNTSFSLTPATVSTSTCYTADYINCNGSSGNPTCETADSLKCGGTYTFIFVSENPEITFQASSGSIDWSDGFTLSTSKSYVSLARLSFSMASTDGTYFSGDIECNESDL